LSGFHFPALLHWLLRDKALDVPSHGKSLGVRKRLELANSVRFRPHRLGYQST